MSLEIEVKLSQMKPWEESCDALVFFIPEKEQDYFSIFKDIDTRLNGALTSVLKEEYFQPKIGSVTVYHVSGGIAAKRVVLTSLGKWEDLSEESFRRASAVAANAARNVACARVAFALPSMRKIQEARLVEVVAEGALLGSYRYMKFKTKEEEIQPQKKIGRISILAGKNQANERAIRKAHLYAQATCMARDMVNEPPNALNPEVLGEIARKVAKEKKLGIKILEKAELERLGAGAILGVGMGSKVPPRLIQLTYTSGKKNLRKIALVGKGITFDSGGLSLKPSKAMETMKCDMAGSAAVLCAMSVLPDLKPDWDVIGILCAAENMPSGSAIRPGDVLRAMNGKSIEIMNTDAEGRLVLADGLSWAARQQPDEIIDLATLTGACVIGLGPHIAGAMGNDEKMISRIIAAGKQVGESFWPLPVPRTDYDFMVKSDIADIKNLAQNSEAGAIQGALFLREFIGKSKWAHLDIAGPAWYDKEFFQIPKNGTGFGVRTLLEYLSSK
jgi:leucyl aminopeptidase